MTKMAWKVRWKLGYRIYTSDKRGEEQKREYEAGDSMVREKPVREIREEVPVEENVNEIREEKPAEEIREEHREEKPAED